MRVIPTTLIALAMLLTLAGRAAAKCGDGTNDAQALAAVRAQVQADCDCAGVSGHARYVRCAARIAKSSARSGTLPKRCRGAVLRCAASSVCGKPGFVACCLPRAGGTHCKIRTASRCAAKGGCASTVSSCCDACATTCVTSTTGTTLPGTTTSTPVTTTTTTTRGEGYQCAQISGSATSEPIDCGASVSCLLDPPGDTDSFTLALPAAAALSINIAGSLDPCWDLRDHNGTSVQKKCSTDNPQEVGPLPAGAYTLIVSESLDRTTDYVLSLQGISEAFHCGTPLALPSSSVNDALNPPGDTDSFELSAAGGESGVITISGPNLPCWRLFGPDGSFIHQSCSAASVGPLAAGTNTIVVRESLDRAVTYSLSVGPVPP